MRLTVVGCAGSFPGPDSAASCYLLEADGFRLAVDLGNGSLGSLQKYAGLFDIDAICLSHLHADHCVDVYSYGIARMYGPAGPAASAVPVYGPEGTGKRIGMIHGPGGAPEWLGKAFDFRTVSPGTFEIGPFQVTAGHVNHPVETFGFRFGHGGRAVAYSGDTGESEALVPLARDSDVFLCEASFLDQSDLPSDLHLSAIQAARYAARAGVGQLVLTHLVAWNDPAASLAEARGAYEGELALAFPGQVIDLLAGAPPVR